MIISKNDPKFKIQMLILMNTKIKYKIMKSKEFILTQRENSVCLVVFERLLMKFVRLSLVKC